MKHLTILFLLWSMSVSAQTAIIIGSDTLRAPDINITSTYTHLNGGKVPTAKVDFIELNGKWLTRPKYFGALKGQGNPAEIFAEPLQLKASQYLLKAGNQGQAAIGVVIIASLVGAIVGGDAGYVIVGAGAITGTVLSLNAWGNTKRASEVMAAAGL
jgi:hypothetical protein